MIGTSLEYLLTQINSFVDLQAPNAKASPQAQSGSAPGRVVFPACNQDGKPRFEPEKISMLLVNLEEDREQRALDTYAQRPMPGQPNQLVRKKPGIRLSLHVLFVASFADYVTAWDQLSDVILGFQMHPVFSKDSNPGYPDALGTITAELISQSLQEQKDLWLTLGTGQQPAVLYRFKLLTLEPSVDHDQPVAKVKKVEIS